MVTIVPFNFSITDTRILVLFAAATAVKVAYIATDF